MALPGRIRVGQGLRRALGLVGCTRSGAERDGANLAAVLVQSVRPQARTGPRSVSYGRRVDGSSRHRPRPIGRERTSPASAMVRRNPLQRKHSSRDASAGPLCAAEREEKLANSYISHTFGLVENKGTDQRICNGPGKMERHASIPEAALRQNARSRRMSGELDSVDLNHGDNSFFKGSLQKRLKVAAKFLQDMSGYFVADSGLEAFRRSLEDGRILCDVVDVIRVTFPQTNTQSGDRYSWCRLRLLTMAEASAVAKNPNRVPGDIPKLLAASTALGMTSELMILVTDLEPSRTRSGIYRVLEFVLALKFRYLENLLSVDEPTGQTVLPKFAWISLGY
eukprot:scaffold2093_cov425-Prasinococcus_capsulatus_cf.AAC.15